MLEVILPCLDEAAALPWVLSRIPAGCPGDRGGQRQPGRQPASWPPNSARPWCTARSAGYGAACHAGLEAATAEFVAFCDCDSSIDPAVLPDFALPVMAGRADLVLGRRRPTARGAWPLHARLANAVLAQRIRRSTGVRLHDIGPLRVARRAPLLELDQLDRRSGYPLETVLLAARAGWRIVESDIDYRPRSGRSKVTGTVRGTAQAIRDMSAVLAR